MYNYSSNFEFPPAAEHEIYIIHRISIRMWPRIDCQRTTNQFTMFLLLLAQVCGDVQEKFYCLIDDTEFLRSTEILNNNIRLVTIVHVFTKSEIISTS